MSQPLHNSLRLRLIALIYGRLAAAGITLQAC